MRIVFMGTPDFAVASLRRLVEGGYNVVAVVTAPDKPAGRGRQVQSSAVCEYAVRVGLRVLQPVKLRDAEFVEQFRALGADLGIVIAFRMLPEVIWSMPRMGTFNLHASLLPQYRGAAPINWAIINGETVTGNTTFMLNERIDEGAILLQQRVDILPDDTFGTLHDRLMEHGGELVVRTLDKIASDDSPSVAQSSLPTDELRPAPKIFRADCRVDFSQSGRCIVDFVRGLSPHPVAWADLHGLSADAERVALKLFRVRFEPSEHSCRCGEIVSDERTFVKIACADGYVVVDELQFPGRRRMETEEFLRGFKGLSLYRAE